MKIRISMKTPDAIFDALEEVEFKDEDEKFEVESLVNKWFKYEKCVILEVDTDAKTCEVLEV